MEGQEVDAARSRLKFNEDSRAVTDVHYHNAIEQVGGLVKIISRPPLAGVCEERSENYV